MVEVENIVAGLERFRRRIEIPGSYTQRPVEGNEIRFRSTHLFVLKTKGDAKQNKDLIKKILISHNENRS